MSNSIDVIEDLLDRARSYKEDGSCDEEAVQQAIDDGLIYTEDILALTERYVPADEIADMFFEKCYDILQEELIDRLQGNDNYEF